MNKCLEVIEAARLFALDEAQIDVLVHPQAVDPWPCVLS